MTGCGLYRCGTVGKGWVWPTMLHLCLYPGETAMFRFLPTSPSPPHTLTLFTPHTLFTALRQLRYQETGSLLITRQSCGWLIAYFTITSSLPRLSSRCRRLQLAISRALFLLQTPPTNQVTSDPYEQQNILHHLLFRGWKIPIQPFHTQCESDLQFLEWD